MTKLVSKLEERPYSPIEAIKLVKENANAKFDETIEAHIRLGIDPKYTDQCESHSFEWPICSKEELQLMDPKAYDLLNNQGFNLPTRIPNGNYQGNS